MTSLLDSVVHSYAASLASGLNAYPYGEAVVFDLPMTYADGHNLSIMLTDLGNGLYNLTDRETAVDELTTAGVNLGENKIGRSFAAILRTIGLPPIIGRDPSPYEISGLGTAEDLAGAIHKIAATMLRAEGLRAVAPQARRLTVGDRLIRQATSASLDVVPGAQISTKTGGSRSVTAQVIGNREVFIQTIGSDSTGAYDHTRSLFTDATLPREQLAAVVAREVRLDSWKRKALSQDGLVIDEGELDAYLRELALAA